MPTVYVLILMFGGGSSYRPAAVTHEFTTLERCEDAGAAAVAKRVVSVADYVCKPK